MEKHRVKRTPNERKRLVSIVTKGQNKASYIQRAHILLKSDEGKTDNDISQWLYVSEQTVRRTRLRFCQDGLEAALEDKPHPPHEAKLNDQQQAYLVALACSTPPDGLEAALEDKPHPPHEAKLNDQQQAYLVALACSTPPDGLERWTMELLAEQLVREGIVEDICPETVRLLLEKKT